MEAGHLGPDGVAARLDSALEIKRSERELVPIPNLMVTEHIVLDQMLNAPTAQVRIRRKILVFTFENRYIIPKHVSRNK